MTVKVTLKETEKKMNYDLIDTTLYNQEREKLKVYLDTASPPNPTVGVGHKVTPEDNLNVGDVITQEYSRQLYLKDRDTAIQGALSIFPDFKTFPDTAQTAILSVIFNVGVGNFSTWKNTIKLINSHDWQKVAEYFNSSAFDNYRRQVGKRVSEIADLFKRAGVASIVFGVLGLGAISFIIYKVIQHRGAAT